MPSEVAKFHEEASGVVSNDRVGRTLLPAVVAVGVVLEKSKELFTGAMENKGAEAVAGASADCNRYREGTVALAAYKRAFPKFPHRRPSWQGLVPVPALLRMPPTRLLLQDRAPLEAKYPRPRPLRKSG